MAKKRRANNEGNLFKHKDGRLVAAVTLPSGRRWTKYSRTQNEARARLWEMLRQIDDDVSVQGGKALLADYFPDWLRIARVNLRPRAVRQYQQIVDQHIVPQLGGI
jgi:hypothetical protein